MQHHHIDLRIAAAGARLGGNTEILRRQNRGAYRRNAGLRTDFNRQQPRQRIRVHGIGKCERYTVQFGNAAGIVGWAR